jgi:hypothetical protein
MTDASVRAEVHISGTSFQLGLQTALESMNLDDRNAQVSII